MNLNTYEILKLNKNICPSGKSKYVDCSKNGIYYHYTSLDTFWKIIKGQSLRATQMRFSNDNMEMFQGIKYVQEIFEELKTDDGVGEINVETTEFVANLAVEDMDIYVICFCEKDDKLSQWRAYCKENGVSIGIEFDDKQTEYYFKESHISPVNAVLYPVFYIGDDKKFGENITERETLKNILKKCIRDVLSDSQKPIRDEISKLIPLIKHSGFFEEEEHRLIIDALKEPNRYRKLIEYKEDFSAPYLTLNFAPEVERRVAKSICDVTIYCHTEEFESIRKRILKQIKSSIDSDKNMFCGVKIEDWKTMIKLVESEEKKIIIGLGNKLDQEKVFYIIDGINQENGKKKEIIPIWCQGHLPVRSITVAPSVDQDRTVSIIKHYCRYTYWLKYVSVKASSTPYRSY